MDTPKLPPTPSPAYRERLSAGITEALFMAGHATETNTSAVDAHVAAEELVNALALVLHASPHHTTPASSRKHCDMLARTIQKRISTIQRVAAGGGLNFIKTVQHGDMH